MGSTCISIGSPAGSTAWDSAQPGITDRAKLPDQLAVTPGPHRFGNELVAEVEVRIHGDAGVVPAEVLQQLRTDVGALADIDPRAEGMERVDAGLLRRVQNYRCLAEGKSSLGGPRHHESHLLFPR